MLDVRQFDVLVVQWLLRIQDRKIMQASLSFFHAFFHQNFKVAHHQDLLAWKSFMICLVDINHRFFYGGLLA